MKLTFRRAATRRGLRLDITPLVDVVFQLMIFFMLTSSYVLQAGIHVNLPSANESFVVPPLRAEVFVTADDKIYFQGRERRPDDLLATLLEARKTSEAVLIFADVDARHGRVVQVEDICQKAGFISISVATEPVGRISP